MLKVVGWIPWDGTMTENLSEEAEQAVIDDIREHGYCFSAFDHQNEPTGAPLFNDGTTRTYSLRGWGRVMATAWDVKDSKDEADYMKFYGSIPAGFTKKMPSEQTGVNNDGTDSRTKSY